MSFRKEDHTPEPEKECRLCGDPTPVSELDENGLCSFCAEDDDDGFGYEEDDA